MGYDPKRPRPVVDRDQPVPVDALIQPAGPRAGRPHSVTAVDDSPPPSATATWSAGSDVPVADPPTAPTANRAVMFVMFGTAAASALILLLVLRRRRR